MKLNRIAYFWTLCVSAMLFTKTGSKVHNVSRRRRTRTEAQPFRFMGYARGQNIQTTQTHRQTRSSQYSAGPKLQKQNEQSNGALQAPPRHPMHDELV